MRPMSKWRQIAAEVAQAEAEAIAARLQVAADNKQWAEERAAWLKSPIKGQLKAQNTQAQAEAKAEHKAERLRRGLIL